MWNNHAALRRYCDQGMWLQCWKDDIDLYFQKGKPDWSVEFDGYYARFTVDGKPAAVAQHLGHRLSWQLARDLNDNLKEDLEATAALQLAIVGWPIIRADALWQEQIRSGSSDATGAAFSAFDYIVTT